MKKNIQLTKKRPWPMLLAICLLGTTLTFSACKKDPPEDQLTELNVDGPNQSAPSLPGNTYEAAVRFLASRMAAFNGDQLKEVSFYIQDLPSNCELFIYKGSGFSTPDSVLYQVDLLSQINANAWNTHVLANPITINGEEDLWLSVKFSHPEEQRTMGCDPGPTVTNGDLTWDANDGQWATLSTRTGGAININWNIRGYIEER